MSSTVPPPPPMVLETPKPVRRLYLWIVWVILAIVLIGAACVFWGGNVMLHTVGRRAAEEQPATPPSGGTPEAALAGLPAGGEIMAARNPKQPDKPATTPAADKKEDPPKTQTPAAADTTNAAVEMRKAAWAAYGQAVIELQRKRLDARLASMNADTIQSGNSSPSQPTTTVSQVTSMSGAGGADAQGDGSRMGQQMAFIASHQGPTNDYSPYTTTNPISKYEVKQDQFIDATTLTQINSDQPGQVQALVTTTITDHSTGLLPLIPQGSKLIGTYNTNVAYGQNGIQIVWTRIIYPRPCDQSLDLPAMPGADVTGAAGFRDKTDNHYGTIFLNGLLVSAFSAGIQLSQPPGSSFSSYNPTQTAAGQIGQQMGQLGMEFARKGMDIPPTQVIRVGYPFKVQITKDIAFAHPWVAGACEPIEMWVES